MTSAAVRSELTERARPGLVAVPALVRGELVWPAAVPPDVVPSAAGDSRQVLTPPVEPGGLVESDPDHLARCLHELPFAAVLDFAARLRSLLRPEGAVVNEVLAAYRSWQGGDSRSEPLLAAFLRMLPELFDPAGLEAAVAAELSTPSHRGRDLLDGWLPVGAGQRDGMAIRLADAIFSGAALDASDTDAGHPGPAPAGDSPRRPASLRAVPTRQLHVTAGNSPVIPALSLLRAVSTKGAAVVKSPVTSWLVTTALALALHRVGRDHPLVHHTSLVYWRGGDRAVEDVLFAPGAFDRVVVWGNAATIASVRARTTARTVFFEPRLGVSLIGREVFDTDLRDVLSRATADSLVENQTACTASLVHYVEGDEAQVLRYCQGLQAALARWDAALPHRPEPATVALLRRLRREELVGAQWFVNGGWPAPSSAVVYARHPFDLAVHPMSRCVVVRRVDDLDRALRFVDRRMSAVGVWPPQRWERLRGPLAARGVTTVAPLGESDRRWAGAPHDGMRVLSELVNWSVA